MRRCTLSRRTVLRGVLGGAAVGVGLPPLEIFFSDSGRAYADGGLPLRFGLFVWGNGVIPSRWVPRGEGRDWQPSEQLEPLAHLRERLSVVSGMDVLTGNVIPHGSGPGGLLSGAPLIVRGDDWTFARPSIDQLIAAELGRDTRFRSLEIGVKPGSGLSFNGPDSKNPPESSPRRFFERVFGGGFRPPGSGPLIDPKLRLRRSVLDVVGRDAARLRQRLGSSDRRRLDQHLEGVRELERRLARLEENPPSLASCAVPPVPMDSYPDVEGRPPLLEVNRVMADILAMALACDQTRVFSHFFTYPVNDTLFPGAPGGHHQLTHDEPGEQPAVHAIVRTIVGELARFLQALDRVPEGDGTLLDNCAILATTDCSFGRTHSLADYPIVVAGKAGGRLRTGLHYRSSAGENASKVCLSLCRAVGLPLASYGEGPGRTDSGLGAIEA